MRRLLGSAGRFLCLAAACAVSLVSAASPEVDRAITWLQAQPQADGTLAGEAASIATPLQSRAELLVALTQLATAPAAVGDAVAREAESATEYSARKIIALAPLGYDVSGSLASLLSARNTDGGFGTAASGYGSTPLDTSFALLALKSAGSSDTTTIGSAISYLLSSQAPDGSYGINDQAAIYVTATALVALRAHADVFSVNAAIANARSWLTAQQSGGGYQTAFDDALAAIAIAGASSDSTSYASLQEALKNLQSADGSWNDDPYVSALAVRALVVTASAPPLPTTGGVRGRAVDGNGNPVAGALVQLNGSELTTGGDGQFIFAGLSSSGYSLLLSKSGFLTVSASVNVVAGQTASVGDLVLVAGSSGTGLQGTVRNGMTGARIAGVTISISGGASKVSDANGNYLLSGLAAGSYTATVAMSGFDTLSVSGSLAPGVSTLFSPTIYPAGTTPSTASLQGHIVDSTTQLPIAGATVSVDAASAATDPAGYFTLPGIATGSVTLQVTAAGYQATSFAVTIAVGANDLGTLQLRPVTATFAVRGTVTDAGTGVAIGGAIVLVEGASLAATTDAAGQYRIGGLTTPSFALSVTATGYVGKTVNVPLSQVADTTVDVTLDRSTTVSGISVVSVSTQEPSYDPFGEIVVRASIQNAGSQDAPLSFVALVRNDQGNIVLSSLTEPFTLPAGAITPVELEIHNTNQPPGNYTALLQAIDVDGVVQLQASTSFIINGVSQVSGGVDLEPPIVQAGTSQPVGVVARLFNHGNAPIPAGPVELTVSLENPDTSHSPLGQATSGPPIFAGSPLNRPAAAAYDSTGALFVVNQGNRNILKLTPDAGGQYTSEVWYTLPSPNSHAMAIDASDNLYVVNGSSSISRLTPAREYSTIVTGVPQSGIAIDPSGAMYVSTGSGSTPLYRVDAVSGTATPFVGSGFSSPVGVAAAMDGTLFVTNSIGNSVARVSPTGVVTTYVTGLNAPKGVVVDSGGNLLIANSGTNSIVKVAPDLTVSTYASGQNINGPYALAIDGQDNLYVGNWGGGAGSSVSKVPAGGGVAQQYARSLVPNSRGMTYDAAGNLFVVGAGGDVVRVDATGNVVSLPPASAPVDVAAGNAGELYVTQSSSGTLVRYSPTGPEAYATDLFTSAQGGALLSGPYGIAFAGPSTLYVSEHGANRISAVDTVTKQRMTVAGSYVNSGDDLYVAANGDRYILNGDRIDKISGTSGSTFASGGFTGQSFVADTAGGFYVQEAFSLKRIDASGSVSSIPAAARNFSQGIALDLQGNLLVGDRNARTILRIDPSTGAAQASPFADLSSLSASILYSLVGDASGGIFAVFNSGMIVHVPSSGGNASVLATISGANRLAFDSADNLLYVKTSANISALDLQTLAVATLPNAAGGTSGITVANGQIHTTTTKAEVRVYDASGNLLSTLAGFDQPGSLVWDGGRIVGVDRYKTFELVPGELPRTLSTGTATFLALQGGTVLATQGKAVVALAGGGSGYVPYYAEPGLQTLTGIAARADGTVTFGSGYDNRFETIDAGKQVVATYAGVGNPVALALDGNGALYVASSSYGQISRFEPVTARSTLIDAFSGATGIASFNGSLHAVEAGKLVRYDATGAKAVVAADAGTTAGMAANSQSVFVVDPSYSRILTLAGDHMATFAAGLNSVVGIAAGPDGSIFAAVLRGSVARIADGAIAQLGGDLGNMTSIAVSNAGRVFAGNAAGFIYAFEPGTYARSDVTNIAQLAGTVGLAASFLATDAIGNPTTSVGNPGAVYRIAYSPPPPPPAAGSVVYSATADASQIPVGAGGTSVAFPSWTPPYAGDFRLTVRRLDGVGGEANNMLHVGPAASGRVAASQQRVPPGEAALHLSAEVAGADFVTISRVDTSKIALVIPNVSRVPSFGADPAGRIYWPSASTVYRMAPGGAREVVWNAPAGRVNQMGAIPFDDDQNFYVVAGAADNRLFGVSAASGSIVYDVTLPERILSIVRDSHDNIWALTSADNGFTGKLRRIRPKDGQYDDPLPTAPILSPYGLTIDGKDNLYVASGATGGVVNRYQTDGTTSVVIQRDASNEPVFELEGVDAAGDCADNLFLAPRLWRKYGQLNTEEHILVQAIGRTGQVAQVLDALQVSPNLNDLDALVYDRFGHELLVLSEESTGFHMYKIPVTCGAIDTDLHIVMPTGQAATGFTVAPNADVARSDGSHELVWNLKDVETSGQSVGFDTTLHNLALGEHRPVAMEASLVFRNSFVPGSITVPLAIPAVDVDAAVDLSVTTDKGGYEANSPVAGAVTVTNRSASQAQDGNVLVDVVDAQGAFVARILSQPVFVPPGGAIEVAAPFDTGIYLAGRYLLRASLQQVATGTELSSGQATFDIIGPFTQLISSLWTDKQAYRPLDIAVIDARVKNVSQNVIASGLSVSVGVTGPDGSTVLPETTREVASLTPNAFQDAISQLRLDPGLPGTYTATLSLSGPAGTIETRTAQFAVLTTAETGSGLRGGVTSSRYVNRGDPASVTLNVENAGNSAVDPLHLTFRIVDPSSGVALMTAQSDIPLPVGGSQQVSQVWDTTGAGAGTYIAAVSATVGANEITLGQSLVTVGVIQPFAFVARSDVPLGAVVESDPVTVAGIVAPARISIADGEYRIGSGGWTGVAGFVNPGDTVTVRVTTSSGYNTTSTATLAIAGFLAPFSVTTVNPDVTPDPFAFTALADQPVATLETSNEVTIAGVDIPVAISVAGGEYSVNAGAWTSAPGTVANGDHVQVRLTSAGTLSTTTIATLTVSSFSAGFSVTTTAEDRAPDAFTFDPQANVPLSALRTSNTVTISGINVAVPVSVAGGEYQVNGGAWTSAAGTVSNGDQVAVRHTSAAVFSTTVTTTLTVADATAAFESTTEGEDRVPDTFAFNAQADAPLAELRESNAVTITGINTSVPITVVGGEYSLNGAPFTSAAGTVKTNDVVVVRQVSASDFNTKTTATLTVADFSAAFDVITKAKADVATLPTFAAGQRVLVLVSCKLGGADDADDDAGCVGQRVPFLDSYLASLAVPHRIVTTTADFEAELRSGRYDTYWVSGGAKKLMGDLAEEVREAAYRGEAVVLDGVHDQRNKDLDAAVGVDYRGKPSSLRTVTLTGTTLPAGSFDVAGSKPIRVQLTTAVREARFNTGDPAISTNGYGYGGGLLFAFDLVGTLMAQPTAPLLADTLDGSLALVAPTVPLAFTGGAYVPLTTTIANGEPVAVTLDVTATLPDGFTLASGAPPATVSASTVTWHVTLGAAASQSLDWAVRVPLASGTYSIPIDLVQTYGGVSIADGSTAIAFEVRGADIGLPGLISQLQALSLTASKERSARDTAVADLQAAQGAIPFARWDEAIHDLVQAGEALAGIQSIDVAPYRAGADQAMKEIEQRWWSTLPACPATPPCRTP